MKTTNPRCRRLCAAIERALLARDRAELAVADRVLTLVSGKPPMTRVSRRRAVQRRGKPRPRPAGRRDVHQERVTSTGSGPTPATPAA